MLLVDTNVLIDIVQADPTFGDWSMQQLESLTIHEPACINDVIYAELSIAFARFEELERVVDTLQLQVETMPREALFLAGKAFLQYKRRTGTKTGVLPDFFIGAHAAVSGYRLLTRDPRRFRSHFPTVQLITPE